MPTRSLLLRSVAYLLPLPGEPTATLDSVRAEGRKTQETLDLMRAELPRGDIQHRTAPVPDAKLDPDEHAARDDADAPARSNEPSENPPA